MRKLIESLIALSVQIRVLIASIWLFVQFAILWVLLYGSRRLRKFAQEARMHFSVRVARYKTRSYDYRAAITDVVGRPWDPKPPSLSFSNYRFRVALRIEGRALELERAFHVFGCKAELAFGAAVIRISPPWQTALESSAHRFESLRDIKSRFASPIFTHLLFLWLITSSRHLDYVIGDLLEDYEKKLQRYGPESALAWTNKAVWSEVKNLVSSVKIFTLLISFCVAICKVFKHPHR